jgi:hypothetical protein
MGDPFVKLVTGYVVYDKNKKRWLGRITYKDPMTGKRVWRKCYGQTKTEARIKLDGLRKKFEKSGGRSINADRTPFTFLAERFKRERLVPAVYVGEKKIAGRRDLISPEAWLKQLLFFFGPVKLNEITKGRIEQFKLWLSKLPTRSQIVEKEGGDWRSSRTRKENSERSSRSTGQLNFCGLC